MAFVFNVVGKLGLVPADELMWLAAVLRFLHELKCVWCCIPTCGWYQRRANMRHERLMLHVSVMLRVCTGCIKCPEGAACNIAFCMDPVRIELHQGVVPHTYTVHVRLATCTCIILQTCTQLNQLVARGITVE